MNTIFEFNGCYYHGYPVCVDCVKGVNKVNKKPFKKLLENTTIKENFIREEGYKLITMWEHNWNISEMIVRKIKKEI